MKINTGCKRHAKWPVLVMSALVLNLSGCPKPAAYREPIARFQQASTVVIESARSEYAAANNQERNSEIDRLAAKKSRIERMALTDASLQIIDANNLQARMAALDALAKHGALLMALSINDAPDRARVAAVSLDDAIVDLSSSLKQAPSDNFKNAAEGFATLAGEAAKLALDVKISQALDRAIIASEQSVTKLVQALKDDLPNLYERRRSHLSQALTFAIDRYNQELDRKPLNQDELNKAADVIKLQADRLGNLPLLSGPGPGLDVLLSAHQALVAYAKSDKSPQDLIELVDAIDAFASRATVIADAIKQIQQSGE